MRVPRRRKRSNRLTHQLCIPMPNAVSDNQLGAHSVVAYVGAFDPCPHRTLPLTEKR
ncbi:hypothetical protein SAMN05428985_101108 [Nocardioides sp. YR527]|nr:hypothetical protein SAMN05428985_101108 [Nocardioides sp. YR527]